MSGEYQAGHRYSRPLGPQNYNKMKLADMDKHLDFWNLMAYDFSGSWDKTAGHMSNVFPSTSNPECTPYSADKAVKDYIKAGIPANKIVLGMPLYGRAFAETDGPGKAFSGTGAGSWENGVWDYKAMPQEGSTVTEQDDIIASYSYDKNKRYMISYDTPKVAGLKAEYIKKNNLGGGMWWESSSDKTGSDSLVGAVSASHHLAFTSKIWRLKADSWITQVINKFGGAGSLEKRENELKYPESAYENIKKGMAASA